MAPEQSGENELTDNALQAEIELVGELVVAASASERQLTDDEIDRALGVDRGHRDAAHGDGARRRAWSRQQA